jgi:hypothetical protein
VCSGVGHALKYDACVGKLRFMHVERGKVTVACPARDVIEREELREARGLGGTCARALWLGKSYCDDTDTGAATGCRECGRVCRETC